MRIEDGTSIMIEVRDEWLQQGLFKELIAFVISNYDTVSSKPMDFIVSIREYLVKNNEVDSLLKLFKKLIKVHTEDLWFYLPQLKNDGGTLNSKQLKDRQKRVKVAQSGSFKLLESYVQDLKALDYDDAEYLKQLENLIAHVKVPKKPRPKIVV